VLKNYDYEEELLEDDFPDYSSFYVNVNSPIGERK
jgi:hypothetical protein